MKNMPTDKEQRKGFAKVSLMVMDKGTIIYTHVHKIRGSRACYTRLFITGVTPSGKPGIQDITHLYLNLFDVPLREYKKASVSGIRTLQDSRRKVGEDIVNQINEAIDSPGWFTEIGIES
jgi:hypothetical protein